MAPVTILVVEDDNAQRKFVCDALSAEGYRVLSSGDGEEALKMGFDPASAPEVLFTDIVMPRLDGVTLAEKLLKRHPRMKVIYTSGYSSDGKFHGSVENEEVNFLEKPFEPEHLFQKIANVLKNKGSGG